MKIIYLYFTITFLFSVSIVLDAQEYSFVNYTTKDGLAGSTVYDAVQDKDGFMWFATENGLSRFDGKTFRNFTVADGLPDNEILKLFVDSKNRVWIMPFKNEICYYYKGKIFTKKEDSVLSKVIIKNHGVKMLEDKDGNLLLCEARGHFYIIKKKGSVSYIDYRRKKDNYFTGAIPGIDEHGEIRLYVPAKDYNLKKISFFLFWPIKNKVSNTDIDSNIAPLLELNLSYKKYLLYSIRMKDRKPYQYFLKSENDKSFQLKLPDNIICLNDLGNNRIAVNTTTGTFFYDTKKREGTNYFFKNFLITNVVTDNEGNYWLSTKKNGVIKAPSLKFNNIKELGDDEISSFFYEKSNTIYMGGKNAILYKMEVDGNKFTRMKLPTQFSDGSKIISIINIKGNLLLASDKSVFYRRLPSLSRIECPKSVWKSNNGILISTCYGIEKYFDNGVIAFLWRNRSTCSVEKDSGYYIGTLAGLFFLTKDKKEIALGKKFPALNSRIVNLEISKDSILWVTTKGRGVCGYKNGKIVYEFNEQNGLSNNDCSCIYADSASNSLWVGTARGLNHIRYSNGNHTITKYSSSDGLMADNITAVISVGNKVFVSTPGGVSYFEPSQISQHSACSLALTGIYVNGNYFSYDSASFSLPHSSNNIRFEFSGISFKSAGEMRYEYRLKGLNDAWMKTTDNNLNFTTLPSGKYTLQLKAVNKYGVESRVKEVSFSVQRLLIEKTWIRLLLLAGLGAIVWLLLRYRIKKIRKENDEKNIINQRIAELEQKALRAQMNPHFIFNCLNSIQQYVAERDIQGANRFITDFSQVIRMTLELSSRSLISLADELNYIRTYLQVEKTRMEEKFEYTINAEDSINTDEVFLPPLLLQPYIENCIRHGIRYKKGNGIIKVLVKKNEGNVIIRIEDNGIGRKEAETYKSKFHVQYQSRGMSITAGRIELMNKTGDRIIKTEITDVVDEAGEVSGTRVDIILANP